MSERDEYRKLARDVDRMYDDGSVSSPESEVMRSILDRQLKDKSRRLTRQQEQPK